MRVILIKHGKTDYNLEERRQGLKTDLPLNEKGKAEAEELKNQLKGADFDFVISSPLIRALETAKIIFPNKEILLDELITEYDFGELEGIKFSEPLENFPKNKKEIYNGITFLMANTGESFPGVVERCSRFIDYLRQKFDEDARIAVVTHSTNFEIIKALAEKRTWSYYLGQARNFHGFEEINFEEFLMPCNNPS